MQWDCKWPLGALTNLRTHSCSPKDIITLGCSPAICVRITLCSIEQGTPQKQKKCLAKLCWNIQRVKPMKI